MSQFEDVSVRDWALQHAVLSNKRGAKTDKIIHDAQRYYGFLKPKNGKVEAIKHEKS